MDQKFNFTGAFDFGDWYFEFLFSQFNVFRLHAVLHDAAGAVRAQCGKGPSYCCMIGPEPNSFVFAHVSKPIPCL